MPDFISTSNLTYIYDGTFYGLLTVVFELEKSKSIPTDILSSTPEDPSLFQEYIHIATDKEKAERVLKGIKKKLPPYAYKRVLCGFLSEAPGVEKYIFYYLHLGWKHGKLLDHHLNHEMVKPLVLLVEKVLHEYHRMLGLARFKLTSEGIYYSVVETDYNILPLISPHFADRMSEQNWIIHDKKRNIASICKIGKWNIFDFEESAVVEYSDDEKFYQSLWNGYFRNIAIAERKNKKLQKQFIPKRYWENLVEVID